ncbi:flagellar biosynthesis repressor FlbT [Parvularcula sp. LCG005]|uniref:flagellar biosynthesis repressor FlbT n=1 Tax=Parvularcula sp. LCG005 TaxID=3078805 RepID=UPI0029438099|nr:flagellar biosynthesis repressor FlbT [Parvularcula sp. LCG005]WOI52947.1 flagellar biosynthesis repressor FlbT [Parvularcula sp. LCG005]
MLNLKPYEKIFVGGVILQNGGRRGEIRVIDQEVGVLRLSDALHPDDVNTPLTRVYYAAQLLLVGDVDEAEGIQRLQRLMDEAVHGFAGFSIHRDVEKAAIAAEKSQFYKVLRILRPLLAIEAALLLSLPDKVDFKRAVND